MRLNDGSRVMAALLVAVVGLLSLLSEAPPTAGAATTSAATVEDAACPTDRLENAWLVAQRYEERTNHIGLMRADQERREERVSRQGYRRTAELDIARRNVASEQIADLVPVEYRFMVLDVAERFNIDPRMLAAVATVESQWHPRALGTHGDSGLMQILPSTARWIAGRMDLDSYDLYDPITNLSMGAWYLQVLHDEYGNWSQALAAYNGGPRGAALGAGHPYTRLVMRAYKQGS